MTRFLDTLLATIAPHACVACGTTGAILCESCTGLLPDYIPSCYRCHALSKNFMTCKKCQKQSPLAQVIVVTEYESIAREVIQKLKFERAYAAADVVARAMYDQSALMIDKSATITHLPTATSRIRQRGYDQARLIAHSLAARSGCRYTRLLIRSGQHRQTGSTRAKRLSQLKSEFVACATVPKAVVLVDDVMTTGASLEAAATVLRKQGATHVAAIVFARGAQT